MRYEFTWTGQDEKLGHFSTSCPSIGESFMRSQTDFPKLPPDIKKSFQELYGAQNGVFEALLRDPESLNAMAEIRTGIRGLTVRIFRM